MKRLILVVDVFTEATALVASMAATPLIMSLMLVRSFPIINFPFLDSDAPLDPPLRVKYISTTSSFSPYSKFSFFGQRRPSIAILRSIIYLS